MRGFLGATCVAMLSACGGGGSGGTPAATTLGGTAAVLDRPLLLGARDFGEEAAGRSRVGGELEAGVGVGRWAVVVAHAEREADQHRQYEEIDQQRAEHEEERCRDQIRQKRAALVLVETGRDEHVDLRGDHRK